jgi:hypothetical protein
MCQRNSAITTRQEITMIGIDLAKKVFQIHGVYSGLMAPDTLIIDNVIVINRGFYEREAS